MATRVDGKVKFSIESGDLAGSYVVLLDFNALCDLEDDFPGLMSGDMNLTSPKAIRKVFAAGLSVDEKTAGLIIQDIGLPKTASLIADAFKASFPEAATGDADPQ